MARQVKCPYCETYLEKEDAITYKKRHFHPNCLKKKEREVTDRKELHELICEIYKIDTLTGMMYKQIKNFQEENKYKLKGIELSLRYFYQTLDNNPKEGEGIGIVPYVYEEAKRHYIRKKAIAESASNMDNHEVVKREVRIKPIERKNTNIIDISSI